MKHTKAEDQNTALKRWTSSGNELTKEEFLAGIRDAEEGTFHSVQESMENFDRWMKSKEKK